MHAGFNTKKHFIQHYANDVENLKDEDSDRVEEEEGKRARNGIEFYYCIKR